jgi:hypothetical protein
LSGIVVPFPASSGAGTHENQETSMKDRTRPYDVVFDPSRGLRTNFENEARSNKSYGELRIRTRHYLSYEIGKHEEKEDEKKSREEAEKRKREDEKRKEEERKKQRPPSTKKQ